MRNMVQGNIYGVVLNDRAERAGLSGAFQSKPYMAPPMAPVVYLKPRLSVTQGPVLAPKQGDCIVASSVALLIGRDACQVSPERAMEFVAATCLAVDVCLPEQNYYRPATAQRCHDASLLLGPFGDPMIPAALAIELDGERAHEWRLERLVRPVPQLIADLTEFMTLRAGDILLVGLPGDAPTARPGQSIAVSADGMARLDARIDLAPQ